MPEGAVNSHSGKTSRVGSGYRNPVLSRYILHPVNLCATFPRQNDWHSFRGVRRPSGHAGTFHVFRGPTDANQKNISGAHDVTVVFHGTCAGFGSR